MKEAFSIEKILGFCTIILETLGLNLLFLASNLFLWLFFIFVGIDQIQNYIFLFAICMLPLGPSLCALFYCMQRIMKEKDITVWRLYKKGYQSNWKQSSLLSLIHCTLIAILTGNINAWNRLLPGYGLGFFFGALLCVVLLLTPNLYLLTMNFKLNVIEVIKTSMIITFGKPLLTLGNTAAFFFVLVLYEIVPGIIVLYMGSIYAFLVLFMNRKILLAYQKE